MKIKFKRNLSLWSFLVAISCLQTIAQYSPPIEKPAPDAETFTKTDELAVPWRETGCVVESRGPDSGCHVANPKEFEEASRLSLYNSDGSLWQLFSLSPTGQNRFLKETDSSLVPFSVMRGYPISAGPILRLIAISPNWYEVEVNEKTKETKFISKGDRSWAKISWDYWLRSDRRLEIDPGISQLFDKPNGNVVEGYGVPSFSFQERNGDWARVRGWHGYESFDVWIQWKKGRDLLVGCVFNSLKVPSASK